MTRKTHYRNVKRDKFRDLSITIPCNTWGLNLTRDTTKDPDKVTCKRCQRFIADEKGWTP